MGRLSLRKGKGLYTRGLKEMANLPSGVLPREGPSQVLPGKKRETGLRFLQADMWASLGWEHGRLVLSAL